MIEEILFTGFDSAWGGRQKGAVCDLRGRPDGERLVLEIEDLAQVDWDAAIGRVETQYGSERNHVIAIDQGLVVPNDTGMRPVERLLAKALMGPFKCGAHASNRRRASCYGDRARIWDFIRTLEKCDPPYRHSPAAVAEKKRGRFFFECYPHPALLALFGLERTLRYKVARGSGDGWQQLINLLLGLRERDPQVANIDMHVLKDLAWEKSNEDKMDALVAAYIAAYLWWFGVGDHGRQNSIILGSGTEGYIVTPCSAKLRELYTSTFPAEQIGAVEDVLPISSSQCATVAAPQHHTAAEPGQLTAGCEGESVAEAEACEAGVAARLTANDPGNLWCSCNGWMRDDRCVGWRLKVTLTNDNGEPCCLVFIPFENGGQQQRGMKPANDDTRLEWRWITEGASNESQRTFDVVYRYEQICPA